LESDLKQESKTDLSFPSIPYTVDESFIRYDTVVGKNQGQVFILHFTLLQLLL